MKTVWVLIVVFTSGQQEYPAAAQPTEKACIDMFENQKADFLSHGGFKIAYCEPRQVKR